MDTKVHQSQLLPEDNKFHQGNGSDGKHYWLTPPDLYASLHAEFNFTFDPCPYPLPAGFDGLTMPWGQSSYVNPPFGSIIHEGKKKGPTAWARKAIAENQQVSQPNPLAGGQTAVTNNSTINVQQDPGRMFKLDTGATLDDLVRAVNQVGVAPGDLMAILEALQQAGAIQGQLVIL